MVQGEPGLQKTLGQQKGHHSGYFVALRPWPSRPGEGTLNWEGRTIPAYIRWGGREEGARTEWSQASSHPLVQSSPPVGSRLREWVEKLTGLFEGMIEELTPLANIG